MPSPSHRNRPSSKPTSIAEMQRTVASMMSNVLYNLAQQERILPRDKQVMRKLVDEWDAIRSAHRRGRNA